MKIKAIIKKHFGLPIDKIKKLEGGFRNQCFKVVNPQCNFVLIIYKKEKGIRKVIQNAHFVAQLLSDKGFLARIPILTINGKEFERCKFEDGYHYVALYNFLRGETIPWEAYTRKHLKSIGKMLSDIHFTLRELPMTNYQLPNNDQLTKSQIPNKSQMPISKIPNWSDITREEIIEMKKYFKEVEPWIEKKLAVRLIWSKVNDVFKACLQPLAFNLQQNILHYDFVRGNILFSDKLDKKLDIYPITGVLDFEKVCIGPEIADIARTLAFLIIDCKFKNEETIRKRFLISGYEKRGKNKLPFEDIHYPVLENLLAFFWLRDFWKFLEHNPYEYLYMNKHYVRTRDRLIRERLLLMTNDQ